MRYVVDDQSQLQKRHLIRCLKGNIIKSLRKAHMMISIERDWTFTQHKEYLTRVDFYQRLSVKKEVIKKSNVFVKQY